jgi:predicted secreted protein
MIVTLYTEEQNTDPAKLAADVSTAMNKALAQAKAGQGHHLAPGQPQQLPDLRRQGPEDHWLA